MNELLASLPFLFAALLAVTLIDTVGAIASRRLNFNYGYFTVLSLVAYTGIGYGIAGVAGINMMLIASLVVGLYHSMVGWKLSKVFEANVGVPKEFEDKLTYSHAMALLLLIAPLFAYIGYSLR